MFVRRCSPRPGMAVGPGVVLNSIGTLDWPYHEGMDCFCRFVASGDAFIGAIRCGRGGTNGNYPGVFGELPRAMPVPV